MYTEQVIDHFTNPRNVGEIENASGVGLVGNAKCGDIMKIFIKVKNNVIVDEKFKTFGCLRSSCTAPCWPRRRCTRPSRTIRNAWRRAKSPRTTRSNAPPAAHEGAS